MRRYWFGKYLVCWEFDVLPTSADIATHGLILIHIYLQCIWELCFNTHSLQMLYYPELDRLRTLSLNWKQSFKVRTFVSNFQRNFQTDDPWVQRNILQNKRLHISVSHVSVRGSLVKGFYVAVQCLSRRSSKPQSGASTGSDLHLDSWTIWDPI